MPTKVSATTNFATPFGSHITSTHTILLSISFIFLSNTSSTDYITPSTNYITPRTDHIATMGPNSTGRRRVRDSAFRHRSVSISLTPAAQAEIQNMMRPTQSSSMSMSPLQTSAQTLPRIRSLTIDTDETLPHFPNAPVPDPIGPDDLRRTDVILALHRHPVWNALQDRTRPTRQERASRNPGAVGDGRFIETARRDVDYAQPRYWFRGSEAMHELFRNLDLDPTKSELNESALERLAAASKPFQCPICFETVANPTIIVPCGHILCQPCLDQMRRIACSDRKRMRCHFCRQDLIMSTDWKSVRNKYGLEEDSRDAVKAAAEDRQDAGEGGSIVGGMLSMLRTAVDERLG